MCLRPPKYPKQGIEAIIFGTLEVHVFLMKKRGGGVGSLLESSVRLRE